MQKSETVQYTKYMIRIMLMWSKSNKTLYLEIKDEINIIKRKVARYHNRLLEKLSHKVFGEDYDEVEHEVS